MYQKLHDVLAVNFTVSANTVEVGDVVVVSADNTVALLAAEGSTSIVGTVCKYLKDATECTVETRFRERRDDRLAGAAAAVGPFVFDASGKVIEYDADSHDPASIAGILITAASDPDDVVETLEY